MWRMIFGWFVEDPFVEKAAYCRCRGSMAPEKHRYVKSKTLVMYMAGNNFICKIRWFHPKVSISFWESQGRQGDPRSYTPIGHYVLFTSCVLIWCKKWFRHDFTGCFTSFQWPGKKQPILPSFQLWYFEKMDKNNTVSKAAAVLSVRLPWVLLL